jgi:hypothetical protein
LYCFSFVSESNYHTMLKQLKHPSLEPLSSNTQCLIPITKEKQYNKACCVISKFCLKSAHIFI